MKKIYSFLVSALLTVAGASAAAPDAIMLKAVDVDAKTNGLETVNVAASVKEASEMKLSKTPVNMKERVAASKVDASKIKKSKARVKKAIEDNGFKWKTLGDAKFTNPLLTAPYSRYTAPTYKVEFQGLDLDYYMSEEGGGFEPDDLQGLDKTFRIVYLEKNNPLIGNGWALLEDTAEDESSYMILDYSEGEDCVMIYDCYLNADDEGKAVNYAGQWDYGYFEPENGKFVFPAGVVAITLGVVPWEADDSDFIETREDMVIQMPGYDFESHITALNGYCAADDKAFAKVEKGDDGNAFSIILNGGMFAASQSNLQYILSNFQNNLQPISKSGDYVCQMKSNDWYSWFVIGTDKNGSVKSFEVAHFYGYAHNPEEWTSLGKALFTDDTMGDMMGSEGTLQQAKVEILENKENPGLYRLINPYTEDLEWLTGCPFFLHGHGDEVEHAHYIDIDATNPESVVINLTPTGMDLSAFSGDQILLASRSDYEGKLVDNKITFPVEGLLLYMGDNVMLANKNGDFSVELPCTLNVIVSDEEGERVAGAYVTANDEETVTDENGNAKLSIAGVLGKKVAVSVYKDGYEPYEGEADFTEGAEAWAIVELKASVATASFMVFYGEDPVEGVYVTIDGKEAVTDENGSAKVELSAPAVIGNKVAFTAYKDGYKFYEGEADFTETMETYSIVELEAEEATLTVIVSDKEEEPVADATVTCGDQTVTTDENGKAVIKFSAPDVLFKQVDFTVTKTGYVTFNGKADFTEGFEAYGIVTLEKDGTDGISLIEIENNKDLKVYDLNGRRVEHPATGNIYIVNGKKIRIME